MSAKVLVIEDNRDSRDLLHLYLTSAGFKVTMASAAAEGLYLAGSEQPDLIISDLGLPDLDGVDLIKRLRELPGFSLTPILVFTALADVRADEAIIAGANRVVPKPSDLEDIVADVQALLDEAKQKGTR